MKNVTFLVFISSFLFTCSPTRVLVKNYSPEQEKIQEAKIKMLYGASISDAAKPDNKEIYTDLIAISPQNTNQKWKEINGKPHVLVVTWIKNDDFYGNIKPGNPSFNTGPFINWVTVVPELKQLCQDKKYGRKEGIELRLKQSLGLSPVDTNYYFAELWVQPQDLYRPCPDSEIDDKSCGLCFSNPNDTTYVKWFNDNRIGSYYQCDWNKNYPWTQLGYTYDWNKKNKTKVGLSEFIIQKQTEVVPKAVYSTADYCINKEKK